MGVSISQCGSRVVVSATLLLALTPVAPPAQELSLDVVLERVAAYVEGFRNGLSGIVSEERYEQQARTPLNGGNAAFPRYDREQIVLRSDFLLVRTSVSARHVEFRDVYEVNGRPTRDRDERLSRLFLEGSAAANTQIQRITNESARYNIGLIDRTLNTPTLALLFLDSAYQIRFAFERVDDVTPLLEFDESWPTSPDVWVVQYQEVTRQTLIRGKGNTDLIARGRFWVDPTGGQVLASELIAKDTEVEATVDVRYAFDDDVGHVVPVEMRESYRDVYGSRVEGIAIYNNFRQFQVVVEEGLSLEPNAPQDRG